MIFVKYSHKVVISYIFNYTKQLEMDESENGEECNKKCNFLERAVSDVFGSEDNYDCDLITHFGNMPKEARSHEDFECMIDLIREIWHNKLWLEHELELKKLMYKQTTETNLELSHLCKRVGKLLVDQDGCRTRLDKVIADVRREFHEHVIDVVLNGDTYTISRGHMRQLLQWYAYDPTIYFCKGEKYIHNDPDEEHEHNFSLGEIVLRKYKDVHGNILTEEVILFRECPHIIDVVTKDELERSTNESDAVCTPRFVWSRHVTSLSPKRYLMTKEEFIVIINDIFNLI